MGLSGVQRTLKFVKYLPEFGWDPIVLTTTRDTPYYAFDESLEEELQPLIESGNVTIYRTDSDPSISGAAKRTGSILKLPRQGWQRMRSKLVQVIRQPDSRIKWKELALQKADEIFANHSIDAIFSTAPPYTDFLIAKELKEKYQVPYLMDYRDAWVENQVLNFYLTPFHKKKAKEMEYECLRASNSITTANRKMKEVLLQNYEFLDWNDVHILPHGYDPEDIEAARERAEELKRDDTFRLTYCGAFYVGRSPKVIMQAAARAIEENKELAAHLELSFVGILQKEYKKLAKKLGLNRIVTEHGYLPHRESVAYALASDVLWMTMSDDLSAPGKMYEYFGTGKPILGLVPEQSHTARLLRDYGNAKITPPDDVQAVKEALLDLYRQWKAWKLPIANNLEFRQRYDRRLITKELARQLTFISGSLEGEIKRLRMKAV
jgi:glycosyltransferase involved in cell wall biosynthesis